MSSGSDIKRTAGLDPLPDVERLIAGLSSALAAHADDLEVLGRERTSKAGTFASEVVSGRLAGRPFRVFCKYGARRLEDPDGRLGGTSYEAAVYRHALAPVRASTAQLYGTYDDPQTGETWLVLACLDGFAAAGDPEARSAAVVLGARWIGHFHALWEERLEAGEEPPLMRYDLEYYRRWGERTEALAGELHLRHPWLRRACEGYREAVALLPRGRETIVHGDYYPSNLLLRNGAVSPIDWGAAAIGAGEIDLASLTQRWQAELVADARAAYETARWPDGTPPDFERRLDVAGLYLCFRWMGAGPEWIRDERRRWRFDIARTLSERLGLLGQS
jgi:hypothetical protein